MSRKLKWTLDYRSVKNVACRVEIYEEGYAGTAVTSLTGTKSPFMYQDDEDQDMLNFMRYRTGYIRVVESTFGELADLAPQSLLHHYVVAKYDNSIVFTGYMQVVQFDSSWSAAPRVLEFPVISPLGLMSSFLFKKPQTEPSLTTIGTLIKEAMTALNPFAANDNSSPGWKGVIYPSDTTYPIDARIHSTAVCPLNDSFEFYDTLDKLYNPISYATFLEGICKCKGWMLHDYQTYLIFTAYDYSGKYSYIDLEMLDSFTPTRADNGNGSTSRTLTNYYQYRDNDALYSTVFPLHSITLENGGNPYATGMTAQFSKLTNAVTNLVTGDNFQAYKIENVGPLFGGVGVATIPAGQANMVISNYGAFPVYYGIASGNVVSFNSSLLIHYSTSLADTYLFTYKIFGFMPRGFAQSILKMSIRKSSSIDGLRSSGWSSNIELYVQIKCAGKYWSDSLQLWTTAPVGNTITFRSSDGKMVPNSDIRHAEDWDGFIFQYDNAGWYNDVVEISVGVMSGLNNNDYLEISSLSVQNPDAEGTRISYQETNGIKLVGPDSGIGDEKISLDFCDYLKFPFSSRRFGKSGTVGNVPSYNYMFKPMDFMKAKFTPTELVPGENERIPLYQYKGRNWRVIASSFEPAEDMKTLFLASSTTIQ